MRKPLEISKWNIFSIESSKIIRSDTHRAKIWKKEIANTFIYLRNPAQNVPWNNIITHDFINVKEIQGLIDCRAFLCWKM